MAVTDTSESKKPKVSIKQLIDEDSPMSSMSFFLIVIVIVGSIMLLVIAFCMIWEVLKTSQVQADLSGYANIIYAIATLFGAGGITKGVDNWGSRRTSSNIRNTYNNTYNRTRVSRGTTRVNQTTNTSTHVEGSQTIDCPDDM